MPSETTVPHQVRLHMKADHDEIERLFVAVSEAFDVADQSRASVAWKELERKVLGHFRAEESHIVPELVRSNPRAAAAILAEHRHLRARMVELRAELFANAAHPRAVRDVMDEFRAHCAHEVRVLYAWADESMDDSVSRPLLQALGAAPRTDSSADSSSST